MRLFISGGTGSLGRRFVVDRLRRGDQVALLTRRPAQARALFAADVNPSVCIVQGDPTVPGDWQSWVDGCDASVHLACGLGAGRCRGLAERQALGQLRVDACYQMAAAIRTARRPPAVHLGLSSLEYYGETGEEVVDEGRAPGSGPLADLARRSEEQSARAERSGCRVVILRLGFLLLSDDVGPAPALGFRSRAAPLSWIHWADLVAMADWALTEPAATGAFNATAPHVATLRALAEARRDAAARPEPTPRRLERPDGLPSPGVGIAALPARACAAGFCFGHCDLPRAVESLRGREGSRASATLPLRRVA